ncbi:MAG: SDR family oxidoreductase [Oscillospiraceae bacterium]|jgi:3-oxoacyl-[acyl-carrier protein] reductase|nr:SDR family oxidoreductase [Oscillospiraceae bacterium]
MAKYLEYGLEGKTAIVTGGGTGVGEACAIELAKGGAKVAVFGRRQAPIDAVAAECAKYTPGAIALSCDVSDEKSVAESVAKVVSAFGKIDILVNNAGIESDYQVGEVPFDKFFVMEPEEYLKFFKIHALGHYLMDLAVVPYMQKNQFGRIVNITSVTAVDAAYSSPAYTASKAAANCQTKAFAKKFGHDNIIVNAIAPGMVNTPMKKNSPPEEFEMVAKMTPIGKVAQPVDIARIAMFLAQEELMISGQVIIADGASHV